MGVNLRGEGVREREKGEKERETVLPHVGHFGSLSHDPNSTFGRGNTYDYKKPSNVTQLSTQSPS